MRPSSRNRKVVGFRLRTSAASCSADGRSRPVTRSAEALMLSSKVMIERLALRRERAPSRSRKGGMGAAWGSIERGS
jgi:hypothetical protein